jgi:hypothetical protein
MHHRNDQNMVRFDGVENGVGKYSGEAAPNAIINITPTIGLFGYEIDGALDGIGKSQCQL